MQGTDPRYPEMVGYMDCVRKQGWAPPFDKLMDEKQRQFQLSGERNQDYDDTVTYAVSDVTGVSDDELQRLHGQLTHLGPNDADRLITLAPPGAVRALALDGRPATGCARARRPVGDGAGVDDRMTRAHTTLS